MNALKFLTPLLVWVLALSLAPARQPVDAHAAVAPLAAGSFVPGELVVGFEKGLSAGALSVEATALAGQVGAQVAGVAGDAALLAFAPEADLQALAQLLRQQQEVQFAEPNFIYTLPENLLPAAPVDPTLARRRARDGSIREVPVAQLRAMKYRSGSRSLATYPNDAALYQNWGWAAMGADIVWRNNTPSKNVCVIDTGVDYLHPDLLYRVIKGIDLVNADANPMDDNGHGTHVAGILVAQSNNGKGIAGVSTGKVVAVKALGADGAGTSFDIYQALYFCSNRADVSVINMSLGRIGYSFALESGVLYAAQQNKLVVAAAGNDGLRSYCKDGGGEEAGDLRIYPAGFATRGPKLLNEDCSSSPDMRDQHPAYSNVLSVGALDATGAPAAFSNYGPWVNSAAPGAAIFSTTPYDRPFFLHAYQGVAQRYAGLEGSSMAAPFVSGAAARAWGYLTQLSPGNNSVAVVKAWLIDTGWPGDWPDSSPFTQPDVAAALQRGRITAQALDAVTAVPLKGALVYAYQKSGVAVPLLRGSGVVTSYDPARLVDLINLPMGAVYQLKVSKAGYTVGAQAAFVSPYTGAYASGDVAVLPGENGPMLAAVPPLSARFSVISETGRSAPVEHGIDQLIYTPPEKRFIVSSNPELGDDFRTMFGETSGSLGFTPFARQVLGDFWFWNTSIISTRPGNTALPYYPGVYTVRLSDAFSADTLEEHNQSLFVWKSGVIKKRIDYPGCGSATSWWNVGTITSGKTGAAQIAEINTCTEEAPAGY